MEPPKYLIGLGALLAVGMASAEDPADTSAQVTIDRGMLTVIRETGVLRFNFASGEVAVSARDGTSISKSVALFIPTKTDALGKLDFTVLGANRQKAGACASEAAIVTATANTAVLACGGGATATCVSALEAFNDAVEAFNSCMKHLQAPPVE